MQNQELEQISKNLEKIRLANKQKRQEKKIKQHELNMIRDELFNKIVKTTDSSKVTKATINTILSLFDIRKDAETTARILNDEIVRQLPQATTTNKINISKSMLKDMVKQNIEQSKRLQDQTTALTNAETDNIGFDDVKIYKENYPALRKTIYVITTEKLHKILTKITHNVRPENINDFKPLCYLFNNKEYYTNENDYEQDLIRKNNVMQTFRLLLTQIINDYSTSENIFITETFGERGFMLSNVSTNTGKRNPTNKQIIDHLSSFKTHPYDELMRTKIFAIRIEVLKI